MINTEDKSLIMKSSPWLRKCKL